jgi:hypothetical protein
MRVNASSATRRKAVSMKNLEERRIAAAEELERNKAAAASALEAKKWEWRQKELAYLEAGQHFRALNQLLWQIPGMVIAVTGGIWYAASTVQAEVPRAVAFYFAGIFNILTIPILIRLRWLIERQIALQLQFEGVPQKRGFRYLVIGCWTVLMATASIVSVLAGWNSSLFTKPEDPAKSVASNCSLEVAINNMVTPSRPVKRSSAQPRKCSCEPSKSAEK